MSRLLPTALICVALLSGCLTGHRSSGVDATGEVGSLTVEWTAGILSGCAPLHATPCFEPIVAIDSQGTLYVVAEGASTIARSNDGGRRFELIGAPPLPTSAPSTWRRADATIQIGPADSLYYIALLMDTPEFPAGFVTGLLRGLQVAASDDAGTSWRVNHLFGPGGAAGVVGALPDRPWLAFEGERVYLYFWDTLLSTGRILVSEDRAATFGPPRPLPISSPPGAGIVAPTGTLLIPTTSTRGPESTVELIATADGGATFRAITVAAGGPEAWPPLASVDQDNAGGLHVAWRTRDGSIVSAHASDGRSWSAPRRWNAAESAPAAPALRIAGNAMYAAWFEVAADARGVDLLVRILDDVHGNSTGMRSIKVATISAPTPTSDFAWIGVGGGRLVIPWTDAGGVTRLARVSPTPGSAGS